jgi:hypothetical protein
MKLDPYIRKISDYETCLGDAIGAQSCLVYLDTSALMWALRINTPARQQFIDWCRSFEERLRIPVWAAHELQRHLIEDTVKRTIKERSSACERQFHDFVSLVAERSDDNIARAVGAGSSDTLIAKAQIIQSQVRKMSDAMRAGNLTAAYEEVIEFVNEFVMESDLLDISRELSAVGEFRYSHRVPPGFQDGAKSENRYGDLVMWEEILRDSVGRGASQADNACIFVSQDEKTDWISASPFVDAGNGPERQNRNHAKDVPLAHPLLQHEYEKRGGSGTVFVVTPRRLSIIASKVANSKPELSWNVDAWGKVSYLDGPAAGLHIADAEGRGRRALISGGERQAPTSSAIDRTSAFPSVGEVLTGSITSRVEKARGLNLTELVVLLDAWLSEVLSGTLRPHQFGRLLASIAGENAVAAIGTALSKTREQISNQDNTKVHFGLGVALYFQQDGALRARPSTELGEIFFDLCREPDFSEGLAILATALREAGLAETFIPGNSKTVSFEIETIGSNPKTLMELRIDGAVVTQTVCEDAETRILDCLNDEATTASAEQLIAISGRIFLIDPDRMTNSYGKRKFVIRPEMGFVELDFKSPEGFQLPSED